MLFYWLLVVVLKLSNVFADVEHGRVIRQAGLMNNFGENCFFPSKRKKVKAFILGSNVCTTPDSQSGTCINIRSCSSLLELLTTRGKEPAVAQFLRRSQCGVEGNSPKVCCPRSGKVTTTTTTTTTKTVTPKPNVSASGDFSQCGKSEKKSIRIVGGQNATLGDWPWMVALGYRTGSKTTPDYKCGATLISNRWVITAAHCVTNLGSGLTLTTTRIGDLDLNNDIVDGASPVDIVVEEIIPHPEYSTSPITNDIALIRLKSAVTFTKYIRPICILSDPEYKNDAFYSKKRPFITGWGATEWRGPTTTRLQEAAVDVVDNDKCIENYANQRSALIDERVICAGKGGKDACQGDSGGPLIIPIPSTNTYYLAGIVSFGIRCADSNYPGVYTRVAYFAEWIIQTAKL